MGDEAEGDGFCFPCTVKCHYNKFYGPIKSSCYIRNFVVSLFIGRFPCRWKFCLELALINDGLPVYWYGIVKFKPILMTCILSFDSDQ